jgi:hypothetical protein
MMAISMITATMMIGIPSPKRWGRYPTPQKITARRIPIAAPTDSRTVPGNAEAGPETHPDNPLRFATKDEAIAYAYNLLMSHFLARATRIVETKDSINYAYVDGARATNERAL